MVLSGETPWECQVLSHNLDSVRLNGTGKFGWRELLKAGWQFEKPILDGCLRERGDADKRRVGCGLAVLVYRLDDCLAGQAASWQGISQLKKCRTTELDSGVY